MLETDDFYIKDKTENIADDSRSRIQILQLLTVNDI